VPPPAVRISTHSRYSGAFDTGRPSGYGVEIIETVTEKLFEAADPADVESKTSVSIYRGDWHDGLRHGVGVEITPSRDVYIGHFEAGRRHGSGKLFFVHSRRVMVGRWVHGNADTQMSLSTWTPADETAVLAAWSCPYLPDPRLHPETAAAVQRALRLSSPAPGSLRRQELYPESVPAPPAGITSRGSQHNINARDLPHSEELPFPIPPPVNDIDALLGIPAASAVISVPVLLSRAP
jgi:hypothetical protein